MSLLYSYSMSPLFSSIVFSCIVFYSLVLYCIVFYSLVLYCIVFYCIVFYSLVLYCILLYYILLYSIVFYSILLYCILFILINFRLRTIPFCHLAICVWISFLQSERTNSNSHSTNHHIQREYVPK